MNRRANNSWYRSQIVRFLVVGGTNTLATGLLVVLFSLIMPGWLAFTLAFALGICFSVALTGRWVFSSRVSLSQALLYSAAYIAIYLCGLLVIFVIHSWGAPPAVNVATIVVTAPLSFLAGRFIFRDKSTEEIR